MKEQPNIFNFATKELSQDAFFAYLISLADDKYESCDIIGENIFDGEHNRIECEYNTYIGKKFVRFLLKKAGVPILDNEIKKAQVWLQYYNIDLVCNINDKYTLVIEDKIGENEHSDQLNRYKALIENDEYFKDKETHFLYIKTSPDSLRRKEGTEQKGWGYISLGETYDFFKDLLNPRSIGYQFDTIISQWFSKLESRIIECDFKPYSALKNWNATLNLYLYLQNELGQFKDMDFDYVPNQSGGFLGCWFGFLKVKENDNPDSQIYLQIENNLYAEPKLCIKIADSNINTVQMYSLLNILQVNQDKYNLKIMKPARFSSKGEYRTLALIENGFRIQNDRPELLDLENLKKTILNAHLLISEFSKATFINYD